MPYLKLYSSRGGVRVVCGVSCGIAGFIYPSWGGAADGCKVTGGPLEQKIAVEP